MSRTAPPPPQAFSLQGYCYFSGEMCFSLIFTLSPSPWKDGAFNDDPAKELHGCCSFVKTLGGGYVTPSKMSSPV